MRLNHMLGASTIALLACTTTGNTGQSPMPGDSTVAAGAGSVGRDSAGGRNNADSASTRVRAVRDSILNATRTATDTVARAGTDSAGNAARTARDTMAGAMRSAADSLGGNTKATIPVKSSTGRDLGSLTVTEAAQALSVSGTLRGLPPGSHGIHFHMVGRCDAPAFTSAGEHWNPTSKQHGMENSQGPHLGDMPNITVGADSTASVLIVTKGGTIRGGMSGLMDADGASIVIHTAADDQRTDPSGNSGGRVACGVVSGS
ncbi:MAG TPA: superoxide dismutase family protein [Gemmatimonadaceae bacterium]|nr:superoxide dismutase family protein [Gemmatimonadaceae bacterium]